MTKIADLQSLLADLRALHERMAAAPAGVAVLHLEASIAALESYIRRELAADLSLPEGDAQGLLAFSALSDSSSIAGKSLMTAGGMPQR